MLYYIAISAVPQAKVAATILTPGEGEGKVQRYFEENTTPQRTLVKSVLLYLENIGQELYDDVIIISNNSYLVQHLNLEYLETMEANCWTDYKENFKVNKDILERIYSCLKSLKERDINISCRLPKTPIETQKIKLATNVAKNYRKNHY